MLISELDIGGTIFETLFDVTDVTDQTVEEFRAAADSKLLLDSLNMLVDWKLHASIAEILNKYTPRTIRYCGGAPYKAVEAIPWKLGNPYWQQYYKSIWDCVALFNRDKQRLCELMNIAHMESNQSVMQWIRGICRENSTYIRKTKHGWVIINAGDDDPEPFVQIDKPIQSTRNLYIAPTPERDVEKVVQVPHIGVIQRIKNIFSRAADYIKDKFDTEEGVLH